MKTENRRATGQAAEDAALHLLQSHGLKLIERNYASRSGEIDLVMDDGGTRVFVEVRYRRNRSYGAAAETVNRNKRMKIIATAQTYLQYTRYRGNCRFDVVALEEQSEPQWIKNAFDAE